MPTSPAPLCDSTSATPGAGSTPAAPDLRRLSSDRTSGSTARATKIARMVPEIGRVTKPDGSPPKISSERRVLDSMMDAEDECQHHRAGVEAGLLHQVADDAERDHQEDVEASSC